MADPNNADNADFLKKEDFDGAKAKPRTTYGQENQTPGGNPKLDVSLPDESTVKVYQEGQKVNQGVGPARDENGDEKPPVPTLEE